MGATLSRPLRVVLLLRSPMAPAWIVELADALLAADSFEVSALIASHDSLARHTKGLLHLA